MQKSIVLTLLIISTTVQAQLISAISLEQYGAKADGKVLTDGIIEQGSAMLKSPSATFLTTDIGKIIYVAGAATNNNTLIASIIAVDSKTTVTLSLDATITVKYAAITYGTDCTNAFINWNKVARLMKDAQVLLNMRPGTYLTSFNNWLAGVKNLKINGNGCKIICTHGAIDPLGPPGNNSGLYMPSCFSNTDNNYSTNKSNSDNDYGNKIQSASKGSNFVKTVNISDANNFRTGNWILVYGFHHEDFNGYPPDPKFFEYRTVKSVNLASGTIFLDKSLSNSYDEGWPDGAYRSSVGAPRILTIDRENFTSIENIRMNDINFLPFNGWTGKFADSVRNGRFTIYGYINATIKNITAAAAYLGQGKNLIIDGCTFKYQCEPDKVLDSVIIENSNIKDFVNAGGLNFLHLLNNKFTGVFNASPHILYLDGNIFETRGGSSTSMVSIGFNKGTDYINVGTNTWNAPVNKITTLFSAPNSTKFTINNIINNNTIVISYADFVRNKNSRQVVPGSVGYSSTGKKMKVNRVYKYDGTNIAVTGNFSQPPSQGDVFEFSFVPNIDIVGKQIKIGQFKNNQTVFESHTRVYNFNSKDNN